LEPTTPKRTFAERLTRSLAIATVIATAILLMIGGMVTSFRAGMTDKVWPTEPWYLLENSDQWREERAGFLIEHSHRAMGFIVGALASLLAISAWFTERKQTWRWAGIAACLVLIALYGQFHRDMGKAWEARQAGAGLTWPRGSAAATAAAAILLISTAIGALRSGPRRSWMPLLVSVALVAVMIQGLLGGFRVYLDQYFGTNLAAIHGTFAQLVFCLLIAAMILTAVNDPLRELSEYHRERLGVLALVLPAAIVLQLVWGVLVRHTGSPLSQRMHILTAFLVTGLAVWLAVRCLAVSTSRLRLGFYGYHLMGVLAVQLILGVEAYMGKFTATGDSMMVPPSLRPVTIVAATIRTAHLLVGTGLLATSVALALRVWRQTAPLSPELPERETTPIDPQPTAVN